MDGAIVVEDVLGAVAMVDVEVDDGDTLGTVNGLCLSSGDGYVVEDAEATDPVCFGMMTRRPNEGKPIGLPAGHDLGQPVRSKRRPPSGPTAYVSAVAYVSPWSSSPPPRSDICRVNSISSGVWARRNCSIVAGTGSKVIHLIQNAGSLQGRQVSTASGDGFPGDGLWCELGPERM